MNIRILAGALMLPAAMAAQSDRVHPGSLSVSLGVGTGSASFSCDACASHRDTGLSGLLRIGVAVRTDLVVAAEASGWSTDYKNSRGTGNARILFTNAILQWFPIRASGFFVKGGGGIASIRDNIEITGLGPTDVTTHSPSFVAGAGWDIPVAHAWRLTPYADYNVAAKSDLTVNSVRFASQLGGNLLHVGVAVTR